MTEQRHSESGGCRMKNLKTEEMFFEKIKQ
jgi:hypothetical protein